MGEKHGLNTPKRLGLIVAANLCYIIALRLFLADNNIVAGGLVGIATVINYLTPIPIGALSLVMNLPIVLIALWVFGTRYTAKIFLSPVLFALFDFLFPFHAVTDDRFAAAIFGGALYSLGAFCILLADTSAGGTDLIARLLLHKMPHLSLGRLFLCVDGLTVVLAMFVYRDFESAVYAVTAITVCGIMTDKLIAGFRYTDICHIVTGEDPERVGRRIMEEMGLGVTCTRGIGMYEKKTRHILIVVVRPRDIFELKRLVLDLDPKAFLYISQASETAGGIIAAKNARRP